jgi:hypothetical protein
LASKKILIPIQKPQFAFKEDKEAERESNGVPSEIFLLLSCLPEILLR